ncbi:hypothetical protein AB3N04_08465 [Alkalihalophilus sp. As8PL]|jgi:hypothetical protein|uniref:NIPSNAP domain-containing protein n=1 Tax=Alkalihalophilus sp. As8PL TaxID=3237103 RepID=A0AB39BXP3_9BACI
MDEVIDVFLEYKIDQNYVTQYEEYMPTVKRMLETFGAYDIKWFEAANDQPYLYVEMFKVNKHEHYEAIKSLRQAEENHFSKEFALFVDGGARKIHCWAFKQKKI